MVRFVSRAHMAGSCGERVVLAWNDGVLGLGHDFNDCM